jgi:uncharacterized protein (DUF1697 family)
MQYTVPMEKSIRYAALLRGINVGGNKKVPMEKLKKVLEQEGFKNVKTLLASGNVLFDAGKTSEATLEKKLEQILEAAFKFSIPVLIRTVDDLQKLKKSDPFKGIAVKPETRLYVTFLSEKPTSTLKVPYHSPDSDFTILRVTNTEVCSVLTVNDRTRSVDSMAILEKEFGKRVTTRNWNTIEKMIA